MKLSPGSLLIILGLFLLPLACTSEEPGADPGAGTNPPAAEDPQPGVPSATTPVEPVPPQVTPEPDYMTELLGLLDRMRTTLRPIKNLETAKAAQPALAAISVQIAALVARNGPPTAEQRSAAAGKLKAATGAVAAKYLELALQEGAVEEIQPAVDAILNAIK